MNISDVLLLCFSIGVFWSLASLLLGGLHLGHGGMQGGAGHGHAGHAPGSHSHGSLHAKMDHSSPSWIGALVNPSGIAIFLAWFGGVGYLLNRHSGLSFWINLALALAVGLAGAAILATFLRFLQSHEAPLDPADYDMVGVLGRVSSVIRPEGVGEVIYRRDAGRKHVPARSDTGVRIECGEEVIVTRYEQGIAYVRTWDAMTQSGQNSLGGEALSKEIPDVS